jgi:tetratricopeptide (TPR) repeat protein
VPVLVLQKLGAGPWPGWHYAVLVGYDTAQESVLLRSGTARHKSMPVSQFLATWDRAGRWAMVALRPGELPPAPDFASYMNAAAGLEAVGRAADAQLAYEAAVRQWPDRSLPRLALANLAVARGDLVAAERGFSASVQLDPADAAARNNRAEVLRRMGCVTAAQREVERARSAAAGGPLEASVASTARQVGEMPPGDTPGCPSD